ncbi:hypothetical protein COV61_03595, partial [Candidatus Micrarchaeota archaeon CG11_big_fil_rev_8_21_14_0_20_47_5]
MNWKGKIVLSSVFALVLMCVSFALLYPVANYTMLGGNYYRTSNTTEIGPYNTINVSWSRQIYDYSNIFDLEYNVSSMSSPIVVNGRVYVAARNGSVYCMNVSNGSINWGISLNNNITFSTLAYSPNGQSFLYLGTRDATNPSLLYINPVNGSINWSVSLAGQVDTSPIVVDDYVYIAAGTYVYAYNATNGSQQFWATNVSVSASGVGGSPTGDMVYNGTYLFVPLSSSHYSQVDALTGSIRGTIGTTGLVSNKSMVYDPDTPGRFYYVSTVSSSATLYSKASDIDGTVIFSASIGTSSSSPAIGYVNSTKAIFVGNGTGIGAYSASSGTLLWFTNVLNSTTYTPIIANDLLYVTSAGAANAVEFENSTTVNGTLRLFNASTGVLLWNYPLFNNPGITRPVVANRTLLQISNGILYAFRDMIYIESPLDGNWTNSADGNVTFVVRTNIPYAICNCTMKANVSGTWQFVSSNESTLTNNTAFQIKANFSRGVAANFSGPLIVSAECYYGDVQVNSLNQTFYYVSSAGTPLNVSINNVGAFTAFPGTSNNSWTSNPNISLTFNTTTSVNQTLNCSIYIDGNIANTTTLVTSAYHTNKTGTFSNMNIPDGYHNVSYSCRDNAGLATKTENLSLMVDSVAPTLTVNFGLVAFNMTLPNGTVMQNNSFMVNMTVNDSLVNTNNRPGLQCGLIFNGSLWNMTRTNDSTTQYVCYFNVTAGLSEAPAVSVAYNWSVRVNDTANNTATAGTYQTIVDNTVPSISNVSLSLIGNLTDTTAVNGSGTLGYLGQRFYVYANVSEPNANLSYFNVSINNGTGITATDISVITLTTPTVVVNRSNIYSLYRWAFTPTASYMGAMAQSNFSVNLTLYDKAGNAVWTNNSVNFSLSSTPIVASIISNETSNGSICSGYRVTISGVVQLSDGTALANRVAELTGLVYANITTNSTGGYSTELSSASTGTIALSVRDTSVTNSTSITVTTCTSTSSGTTTTGSTTSGGTPYSGAGTTPTTASQPNVETASATVEGQAVEITRSLDVYAAASSGGSASSQITVSVRNSGQQNVNNIEVREHIPDSIATDVSQLQFSVQPDSFEQGSIIAVWKVAELAAGETFSVWYSVNKVVTSTQFKEGEASAMTAAQAAQEAAEKEAAKAVKVSLMAAASATVGDTISITAKDEAGAPISGLEITVTSPSERLLTLTTDASGKATFTAGEAGAYKYSVGTGYLLLVAKSTAVSAAPEAPSA